MSTFFVVAKSNRSIFEMTIAIQICKDEHCLKCLSIKTNVSLQPIILNQGFSFFFLSHKEVHLQIMQIELLGRKILACSNILLCFRTGSCSVND